MKNGRGKGKGAEGWGMRWSGEREKREDRKEGEKQGRDNTPIVLVCYSKLIAACLAYIL